MRAGAESDDRSFSHDRACQVSIATHITIMTNAVKLNYPHEFYASTLTAGIAPRVWHTFAKEEGGRKGWEVGAHTHAQRTAYSSPVSDGM